MAHISGEKLTGSSRSWPRSGLGGGEGEDSVRKSRPVYRLPGCNPVCRANRSILKTTKIAASSFISNLVDQWKTSFTIILHVKRLFKEYQE